MNDVDIAATFRTAFLSAESPDAPVNSIRRRLAAQPQPRPRLSYKALTVALVLSTTGLAFAAPQSRAAISATGAAIISSLNTDLRQLMNTVPIPAAQVSREVGHQVNIPTDLVGLNRGSVVKIGDAPKIYRVNYTGKSGCSIDLTLTLEKTVASKEPTFVPLPGGGTLFGASANDMSLLGSSHACSDTSGFVKAFLANQ
jgi:hypothetical protein